MYNWGAPWILLLLLAWPAAFIWLQQAHARVKTDTNRYAEETALAKMQVSPSVDPWRHLLLVLAGMALTVALAQPRIGAPAESKIGQIALIFDVSKSMTAQDVGSSRLGQAKNSLLALLGSMDGYEASLVVFAEKPMLLAPRTLDMKGIAALSERIGADALPAGSNLEEALKSGAKRVEDRGTLVLFTDGEELQGKTMNALRMLKARKITVHTLGYGTSQGTTIPELDPWGNTSVHQYQGQPVTTRLNRELLAQIAHETGGGYYENPPGNPLRFRAIQGGAEESPVMSLAWIPGLIALGLLVAAHLKRLLLIGLVLTLGAWTPFDLYHHHSGMQATQNQEWRKAEKEFSQLKDSRGLYNLGVVYYRQGEYQKAKQAFEKSLKGGKYEALIRYNLGNTLYQCGKPHWKQAIKEYKRVIALNPKDEDARYNLKVIEDKLKPPASKPDKSEADEALGMLEQSEREMQAQRKMERQESVGSTLENLWKAPQQDW